jgi:hypothetical protein
MIETIKFMILDCTNNEQKAFVVNNIFEPVCSELANVIKLKDSTSMSSVIEVLAEMMSYMNQ